MLLSELQNKTLINIFDGKNIGNIVDIEIDSETFITIMTDFFYK